MSVERRSNNITKKGACPICLDEDIELITLSKGCSCSACSTCMQSWLSTSFSRNNIFEGSCHCCRRKISKEEIESLFSKDVINEMMTGTGQEENLNSSNTNVDDLTSDWLSTNGAKQCRNCGAWIIREDGCDAMICLCGHRFCWVCYDNDEDDECCCGFSDGDYFDNILGLEVSEYSTSNNVETIVADSEDLHDLRAFMECYRSYRREQYSIASSTDEDSNISTLVDNATSSNADGGPSHQEESRCEERVHIEVEPISQNNNDNVNGTTFPAEMASTTNQFLPGLGRL